MKAKAAEQVGVKFRHVAVPVESSAEQIVKIVEDLNADDSVSGILVQLPLGDHITSAGERLVTEAVSPHKDVDG
jgi:methylenetetrahydrofolate dehydrogenase (NADP+)/methenyltetrahydrofolate cyclohydrolase/formyltetrahydrofolate synthetase